MTAVVAADDPAAARRRVIELGGTAAPEIAESDRFTVMRDIEDNEFCIVQYSIAGPFIPPADLH